MSENPENLDPDINIDAFEDEETESPTPEPEATEAPAPFMTPLGATMPETSTTPETELGFSYEYGIDIKIEDAWQKIRFTSNVNPATTDVEKDGATYDDEGSPHPVKVGENTQLDFYVQMHRLTDGKFLPEMESILAATRPGVVGGAATREFRVYDNPAEGTPNPDEAYELTGTVSVARAQTGNDEIAGWNVTVKGQGPRRKVANPAAA